MKLIVCIFLLSTFAVTSFARVARDYYNDPRYPGKCTINDNLILSPGDKIKNSNRACGRIICVEDGAVTFNTCRGRPVEGCTFGDYIDKSLPYPECCKRHVICT